MRNSPTLWAQQGIRYTDLNGNKRVSLAQRKIYTFLVFGSFNLYPWISALLIQATIVRRAFSLSDKGGRVFIE